MSRVIDLLRTVSISVELLLTLIIIAIYILIPTILVQIGHQFKSNLEVWKFLPSLPLLFAGVAIKVSAALRSPTDPKRNKILYEWSDYNRITDRVYIGIAMSVVSAAGAVGIWIFAGNMSEILLGAIFLGSVSISGAIALSFTISSHRLKELLEKHIE